ncbi:MAG: PadR family transcriptional regulator [Candidatus Bilamarchaeaceae archaeon]
MKKNKESIEKMHKVAMRVVKKSAILFILWLLSKKEMNGYEIIKTLAKETMVKASPRPAMIYPMLNNLCKKGLLACEARKEGRRLKKYYKTTEKGKIYLGIAKEEYNKCPLLRKFVNEMIL